jgi:hypothetical protein
VLLLPRRFCRYWEVGELVRKLCLTGFVFLIPPSLTLVRLLVAMLITFGHVVLLLRAAPYTRESTAFVAVGAAVTFQCTLLAALLLKMSTEGQEGLALPLAMTIFGFNLAVLAGTAAVLAAVHASIRTLTEIGTGRPPTLALAEGKEWHLFLSHSWDDQDAVHTIKRQLQLLLPGARVFLDVDDLDAVDALEAHVGASAAVLVFLGSARYLSSANCLREVTAAQAAALPLVRVHDERSAALEALVVQCKRAHQDYLFPDEADTPVIAWHRARDFQLASLGAIAEQLLRASPAYDGPVSLQVRGALPWLEPAAAPALRVYASPHNAAAFEVRATMCALLGARAVDEHTAGARWLLVLHGACFEGALGEELEKALDAGVEPHDLVMVYDPTVGTVGEVIDGAPELRLRGLFDPLILEWRAGAHRRVSERLVARALATALAAPRRARRTPGIERQRLAPAGGRASERHVALELGTLSARC